MNVHRLQRPSRRVGPVPAAATPLTTVQNPKITQKFLFLNPKSFFLNLSNTDRASENTKSTKRLEPKK
jgi:hypothetical protein